MTDNSLDKKVHSLLSAKADRRRVLGGLGAAALAAGFSPLLAKSAWAAGDTDFSKWLGRSAAENGAGLAWSHGLNIPLTGQGADIGKVMAQGAQLAAEVVAASGGPTITIELNDHQSGLVPPAVQGVRRLISQKNINSLASAYGAATEALFPLIDQFGVTLFWAGGPAPSGLNKPHVFLSIAMWALDPAPGGIAYMAKTFPDAKRLAILGVTENGLPAVNEIAPKTWSDIAGGEVVFKDLVNAGATDFSASVSKIKAANPDVIFTTLYGNDEGFFIKQVREAGIKAPILVVDLGPPVAKIAGSTVADNCFLATDGYLASNPNPYNQAFVKAYNAKFGGDPDFFAANFFESVMLTWGAIQRTIKMGATPGRGSELTKAILAEPEFPTIYGGDASSPGVMTFNADHSVNKPMGVFKIGEGGALTKVASISKGSTDFKPA